VTLTPAEVAELRRLFHATMNGQPQLLTPLSLRVRVKLRLLRGIDAVGIWLCGHHAPELAVWWWKAWRQW
jgi:hypothetical protein